MTWRTLGDVSSADFAAELRRLDSPMVPEARAVYDAVKGYSALFLAKSWVEQKHATYEDSPIPTAYRNPMSLAKPAGKPSDGLDRWERFASWAAGAAAWVARITSPTYKGGIYARTVSLRDLVWVFAPPSENDSERYLAQMTERLAAYPRTETPTMPTELKKPDMRKGLIPLPGFVDQNDTFAKRNGVGMNLLGPRTIDVLFFHRALGEDAQGVADWLKRADVQGLTDWVIDDDTAYMIRLEKVLGAATDMSGWAQGPYRAPTADLRTLTAKFGGSADTINRHGESIEVAGFYDDAISAACKRDLAQWAASRAQDRGIEWGDFPLTPDGYSFIHGHREACGIDYKVCPGSVVWSFINDGELIEMVRALLRTAQTGGTVPTTPVQSPPSGGKPAYAMARPIAALAALELDDLEGLAAVTTKEGTTFRPTTDQVVAVNATPRFQVANVASTARVGPDIKAGEDFNPAWEFEAADGEVWYLTPYWTRVRKQDTRVVGAGPLTP